MNEKITKNTPAIFERYQAQSQRNADIEDGNTVNNTAQSKIWTSDISSVDGYTTNYAAPIISLFPPISNTGQIWNYVIQIDYDATLQAGGSNPGFFGSNLLKANDNFIIGGQGHDWVKGFINKILDISYSGGPSTYTYNYTLFVTIVDGEPLKVKSGTSTFYWNRQIADNPESLENKSPDSISVSYNPTSHETKLFWKDYNQTAKRHIVKIRDTSNTDTLQLKYLPTFGNLINFNGKLEPIIDANTGDVSTVKIVDPGFDFTHPRRIEFIGDGRGAIFLATPYTFNGSLPIHDYEVVGVSTGTGDILVKSKQTYPIWGWPLPVQDAYIEGLPTIVFDKYKVSSVTQVNDNLFVVSLDYPENSGVSVSIPLSWTATVVNSTIKIHNGIQRVNLSGLPIVTELNNNKVQLQGNQFLSNWFVGCNVSSPNLPANTYITNITNSYIEFNNKGITSGSTFLDISGNGIGYTSKTRAKVQEVSANPNLHIDPVWEQSEINDFLYREEQAVSVASIFDELQKNISQWSEEVYTKSI